MSPRLLYRRLARAEVVTWTLLIIGMVLKYATRTTELGVRVGGLVHGVVFLAYALVTVVVAVDRRWPAGTTVLGLVSAVVPYATVPFESYAERRRLLTDRWRLAPGGAPRGDASGGDAPRTLPERVVAAGLARPLAAVLVAVVVVAVVTAVLLWLGPPVPQR
ncbi:DUF3817 domain-containing protein [Arsenicicoccus sp. oral taxon 190]|uniref:DUF3817 domain-containing protein n=1 Tax=Arsenicicoccus sp. oral taxon 190 TaxID=1658671 RepID=UPI000679FCC0|nr:DUF3817 domain-containing protein [Arsenicicoccus sp. oral taxon 190]AKT50414.1 membrane protein [Arsenicicoccus sp. oral taxon 190]